MDYWKVEEILYASNFVAQPSHVFCGDIHIVAVAYLRDKQYLQSYSIKVLPRLDLCHASRKISDQQELFYVFAYFHVLPLFSNVLLLSQDNLNTSSVYRAF